MRNICFKTDFISVDDYLQVYNKSMTILKEMFDLQGT